MRLKSIYISDYKNLKNFSLNFDGGSFIDVFVGKNGSGKSNLFEALIEIFRHLYEYDKPKEACKFGYRVCFAINGEETTIEWKDDKLTINGKERKTIGETPLPDNVLIYYSGHNNTVAQLVTDYEESFRKRIKKAEHGESRPFIGIGSDYKELLLSVLLMQPAGSKARQFIFDKLGIKQIVPVVNIILQRPHFADAKLEFEEFDPKSHFWGIEGITRDFLDALTACIKGEFSLKDLYKAESKTYKLEVDMELLHAKLGSKITSVFHLFDNLKMLGMLSKIWVPIIQKYGNLSLNHFSDGQFQSVYIYAIMEIFKDRNCITLLDEPDAFLHPEWQFDFLKQVFDITDTTAKESPNLR